MPHYCSWKVPYDLWCSGGALVLPVLDIAAFFAYPQVKRNPVYERLSSLVFALSKRKSTHAGSPKSRTIGCAPRPA